MTCVVAEIIAERKPFNMATVMWVMILFGACRVVVTIHETCPSGYTLSYSAEQCFKKYGDYMTWLEARDACQSQGYGFDLVKIVNEDMAMQIREASCELGWYYVFWIGLNDIKEEGTWVWLDEEEEITYWYGNLPSSSDDSDCIYVVSQCGIGPEDNNYLWTSMECDKNKIPYVCGAPAQIVATTRTTMKTTTPSTTTTDITVQSTTTATTKPSTTNDITVQSTTSALAEPPTTTDITTQSTTTATTKTSTTNDITAQSAITTVPEPTANAESSTTSTTDSTSPSADETSGRVGATSLGSIYTYLLAALVAVLVLILIVQSALCYYFGNRIIKKMSEPAATHERITRKDLVQFSNTVYDFPDGEQGTIF